MGHPSNRIRAFDLEDLATAFMTSQVLHVADKLGIADALKNGPAPAVELARATGCHPRGLVRLLRALTGLGILSEDEAGRFRLSAAGARLARGHPASLAPIILETGAPHIQAAWLELAHAVRTGSSAFQYAHGTEYWTYVARHPELAAARCETVADRLSEQVRTVVAGYDFSSIETIMDVGGGRGSLLAAILERNPALRGILFEQPAVGPIATAFLANRNLADRARVVTGDFFRSVPRGADAYLLANVIDEWSDADSIRILRNCRHAVPRTSRLWLVERLGPFSALEALERMVLFGESRERTKDELCELVEAAGFDDVRVVSATSGSAVLEATTAR